MDLKTVWKRMSDEKTVIIFSVSCISLLILTALLKSIDGVVFGAGMTAIGAVVGWYFKGRAKHEGH